MVSPTGVGFYGTLLPFMAKYIKLIGGEPVDVPFDIDSTIVAYVGGPDGYLSNVQYSQNSTMITVKIGGKVPEGGLPSGLGGLLGTTTTTMTTTPVTTEQPSATSTGPASIVPTESSKESPNSTEKPSTEEPTTTTTDSANETQGIKLPIIGKRQDFGLKDLSLQEMGLPLDAAPEVVEAWVKSVINNLAQDEGLPPPFV
ncbi:hypothetical protein BGZ65_009159 [Modicella reniformis]|uniref:Uncharacterized protein n=1 Tax=Modicella reniformis TaxID=1440133 RepID=A0A9P6ITB9_9FUNG|nr:hypothetical protein BGZ65_009159 [Modicella reniformis]